jgi:hypothetical protein
VTQDVDERLARELASRDGRLRVAGDEDPREQLEGLLGLPAVGVKVTRVAMFGQGAAASIDIELSNGETMVFGSVREMVRPQSLIAELVACSGATPELKQPQAVRIVKLARLLAERVQVDREDADSRDWGIEFLQQAEKIDFALDDQLERWRAFELLSHRDPWATAREDRRSYASACIVLRDVDGSQLVRAEWFLRYVRSMVPRETPASLRVRMERVGWQRRGSEGRIKATAPARTAELIWAFWIVPVGWGQVTE